MPLHHFSANRADIVCAPCFTGRLRVRDSINIEFYLGGVIRFYVVEYKDVTFTNAPRYFMFSIFKSDPTKKLRKSYDILLERAMHLQRKGDIMGYSNVTAEAEAIWQKIEALEAKSK